MPENTSPTTSHAERFADERENERSWLEMDDVPLAPHCWKSMTISQEDRVRTIYRYLSPYLSPNLKLTLERFEAGFLRDRDREREIRIWLKIIQTHRCYLAQHPESTPDDGRDVFKCLMMISTRGAKPFTVPAWLWKSVNQFVIAS
jgi:hypothetical protein